MWFVCPLCEGVSVFLLVYEGDGPRCRLCRNELQPVLSKEIVKISGLKPPFVPSVTARMRRDELNAPYRRLDDSYD